LSYIPLCTS